MSETAWIVIGIVLIVLFSTIRDCVIDYIESKK